MSKKLSPRPVILDTDIGGDIDDTWALALLLRCPELDVKLVVADTADTTYRAKIAAKLLAVAGRTDIPVAVGVNTGSDGPRERQKAWVHDYDLASYPGTVCQDGVEALVETILKSPEPITLIAIGPVTNLAVALERQPRIAEKAHFIGMHGSVRKGYFNEPKIAPEFNVVQDVRACQKVFTAPWRSMAITPVDTCSLIRLFGPRYQSVLDCPDPLVRAVVENYRLWSKAIGGGTEAAFPRESSVLYDTVAIYLAISEELLVMEELGISISDDGYTLIDPRARPVRCALDWKDQAAFEDWMVTRLIRGDAVS